MFSGLTNAFSLFDDETEILNMLIRTGQRCWQIVASKMHLRSISIAFHCHQSPCLHGKWLTLQFYSLWPRIYQDRKNSGFQTLTTKSSGSFHSMGHWLVAFSEKALASLLTVGESILHRKNCKSKLTYSNRSWKIETWEAETWNLQPGKNFVEYLDSMSGFNQNYSCQALRRTVHQKAGSGGCSPEGRAQHGCQVATIKNIRPVMDCNDRYM